MTMSASEDWKFISYILHNDPVLITSWLLIGAAGFLGAHMQLLVRAGNRFPWGKCLSRRGHEVISEYLKLGRQRHWSLWPAYLMWPTALIGIICLVTGLLGFR
jgi:hypothetical protein